MRNLIVLQITHIEGQRYVNNLVAQVDTQTASVFYRIDIKRCGRGIGHGEIIDIDGRQDRILSGTDLSVITLTKQQMRGTTRRTGVNRRDGHNTRLAGRVLLTLGCLCQALVTTSATRRNERTDDLTMVGYHTVRIERYRMQAVRSGLLHHDRTQRR